MKKKIICFDIDNVICKTNLNIYKKSIPNKKVIYKVNGLFEKGHIIKLFTARFMGRSKENKKLSTKKAKSLTEKQLKDWGVKYNHLIFGKPSYDFFIDDKALTFDKMWYKKLNKLIKK